ncbi:MAG: DUF1080 domain-containing protein [Sedimentisphaerales bacterium]|nr:DUF1080 domain-containing protein [Sedimentisphaerales bacterium]
MRSKQRNHLYLIGGVIILAAFAGILAVCPAEESETEKPSGNSKCYVCHPDMKTEEISTMHLEMDVTCDVCHGASTEHMHDEMLMTEPDILFGRKEVERMCSDPSCHKPGEGRDVYGRQDHKNQEAVEAFFQKWTGRMRPNGRAVNAGSVCTDCHGTHNISKPLDVKSEEDVEWIAAFNGTDFSGWQVPDNSCWSVKSGRIIGIGEKKGDTLWTQESYEDYQMAVTFRATWPIHAGIWLRGQDANRGPRVEITEPAQANAPKAYTGSVLIPGKGLALVNLREDLVDCESWNTISIKVEGDKAHIWLNGEEIGSVRFAGPDKGHIGLFIGKSPTSKPAELSVREVLIQRLAKSES